MKEKLRQTQQQRQQQRLLPLQVLYGRMLEMTGPEVEDAVRQMLDDNPALGERDKDEDSEDDFDETADEIQLADYLDEDEVPYNQKLTDYGHGHGETYSPELADENSSLTDYLLGQLVNMRLDESESLIARYIIGNLNDNGYLERDIYSIVNDIEQYSSLRVDGQLVGRLLAIIQTLDPAGVGARNLRECLLLQLKRRASSEAVDDATVILNNYFDLFSLKHYARIASAMGIEPQRMHNAVEVIKSLNPKPGAAYNVTRQEQRLNYIVPDFAVDVDGDRLTVTALNHIPELAIETTFTADAEAELDQNSEARLFIRQKRDEAQDFIQLLQMRQSTLMRVVQAIVSLQSQFFLVQNGDKSLLKPMILRDIAGRTGLDLSVISRAVSGKYLSTVSGIYPLKMFFNEKFHDASAGDDAGDDKGDVSAHAILEAIRSIIAEEDKRKPLNDEMLAKMLHDRGFDVARRTVAKYREKLGLPVARLRRDY